MNSTVGPCEGVQNAASDFESWKPRHLGAKRKHLRTIAWKARTSELNKETGEMQEALQSG